jgi:hypothetical protein
MQIAATYQKRHGRAQLDGEDMHQWRKDYASWKSEQVLQHEYGLGDFRAIADFYRQNPHLPAMAHVEPTTAAVPDVCQDWIDLGEIPVQEAIGKQFPAHPSCPHAWAVRRTNPDGTEEDLGDTPPEDALDYDTSQGDGAPMDAEAFLQKLVGSLGGRSTGQTAVLPAKHQPISVQELLNGLSGYQGRFAPPPEPTDEADLSPSSLKDTIWLAGMRAKERKQKENQ